MDVTELSAHALSRAIHAREVSCRDVMHATLARIDAVNPLHNAIVSLRDADGLLQEASACDLRLAQRRAGDPPPGWMHGMPQAIKDMAPTAGLRTTLGSRLLANAVPATDNLMVHRMKAAGCIVIGKTNTPEFGLGSHTFNEVFGVTRNAYDPSKSAGGSSGGAAVALALHMLPVADGSDFMGSLRNPAAWNNIFGLRPSQGRVPAWPDPDVFAPALSTTGPMARTVEDLALLLDVQAGFDPRAPSSLADERPFAEGLDEFDPRGVRVGWLRDLEGHLATEPGILDVCEQGLRHLTGIGCAVEAVPPTFDPAQVWTAWLVCRHALVAARIAPLLVPPPNRALVKAEALWECDQAATLTAAQITAAGLVRSDFYQKMLALLERHDVLALPAAQVWPFDADLRWPAAIAGRAMDTYHRWMEVVIYATFAGLPCISVPVGFGPTGLPMGLQLIGRPRGERALLRLGRAYEQTAAAILLRRPPEDLARAGVAAGRTTREGA